MKILLLCLAAITLAVPVLACTDIIVGKAASTDGSVITSHTGSSPECRVHVVPGREFPDGAMAPVYYGMTQVQDGERYKPLHEYGEVIGHVPQVRRTFTYFHSGYSQMNEKQLAIGETTMSQRAELEVDNETGKQIITVEQAMAFALERCETARGAIDVITALVEEYGFLPSTHRGSECLCIADPQEAWVLELCSVGEDWEPGGDELGAIWAAQRVPEDHVAIVPNWSVIKQIDIDDAESFRASANYLQIAIDHGWYDPDSGFPFVWQDAYAPTPTEWATGRLWLFFTQVAPNLREWPDRWISDDGSDMHKSYDAYHQVVEPLSIYPFSVKPEKKLSVQDVIAFQRSTGEGTIYDMTGDTDWLVPGEDGSMVKSPLATPFPTQAMRELLDITWRRNVSKGGYGMVCQLRDWLPDAIGGVYWFYLDNQYISTYVPIYAGTTEIHQTYREWDPDNFSEDSARWAIDFVDNLLYLNFRDGMADVKAQRDPLEAGFGAGLAETDAAAASLWESDPDAARALLTKFTQQCMVDVVEMYRSLRNLLISKYTNTKEWL